MVKKDNIVFDECKIVIVGQVMRLKKNKALQEVLL